MYWQCDFLGEWGVDWKVGTPPPSSDGPPPLSGEAFGSWEGFGVEVRVGLGGGNPTTA